MKIEPELDARHTGMPIATYQSAIATQEKEESGSIPVFAPEISVQNAAIIPPPGAGGRRRPWNSGITAKLRALSIGRRCQVPVESRGGTYPIAAKLGIRITTRQGADPGVVDVYRVS